MEPFVFAIASEPSSEDLELIPCPLWEVTKAMWDELAAQFTHEPTLIPCSGEMLARRCAEGYTAVAIWHGQVVSHTALVPLACRTGCPGMPHTWASLCRAGGLSSAHLPSLDVYEFTSGWTAPNWRRKRVSLSLRKTLLSRYLGESLLPATCGCQWP
jgi:hypothetical protein